MSKDNQWIAGINAVAAAVEHDAEQRARGAARGRREEPAHLTEIEDNARRKDIDVRRVAQQALDGVAGGLRHQGVVARYAAAKTWDEHELQALVEAAEGKALLLVLDGVQDPHNLGACLRSAAAAGVDRGGDPEGQGGAGQRHGAQDLRRRGRQRPDRAGHQPLAHAARPAEAGRVDLRSRGRRDGIVVRARPARQRRAGARRRGRRPAPADARAVRSAGRAFRCRARRRHRAWKASTFRSPLACACSRRSGSGSPDNARSASCSTCSGTTGSASPAR